MTINEIFNMHREDFPNHIEINYTNENGVCWRTQLSRYCARYNLPFINWRVQSFNVKEGIFSICNKDLPECITAVNNYVSPSQKSDLDSGKMTVRDYLATQKNIKKVRFVRVQRDFPYKEDILNRYVDNCIDLHWYTDYFDVKELSSHLSFMADLFIDTVEISNSDETSLKIFTTEYKDWEREKNKKESPIQTYEKKEQSGLSDVYSSIGIMIGVVAVAVTFFLLMQNANLLTELLGCF